MTKYVMKDNIEMCINNKFVVLRECLEIDIIEDYESCMLDVDFGDKYGGKGLVDRSWIYENCLRMEDGKYE